MDKIKNDIGNIDWETEIKNQDVNKAFEIFHNKLLEILNLHAPERTIYLKEKRTNKPWISKNLANSISIKPDTPINVYTLFCLNTAKSKFSLVSPVADW